MSDFRKRLEKASAPYLARIHALPRWVLPVFMTIILLIGLAELVYPYVLKPILLNIMLIMLRALVLKIVLLPLITLTEIPY